MTHQLKRVVLASSETYTPYDPVTGLYDCETVPTHTQSLDDFLAAIEHAKTRIPSADYHEIVEGKIPLQIDFGVNEDVNDWNIKHIEIFYRRPYTSMELEYHGIREKKQKELEIQNAKRVLLNSGYQITK